LGLFDFHDHSIQKSSSSDNETNERVISLCLNRFKKCRIDPSSHTYILDIEQEDSKNIETDHIFFHLYYSVCFKFNATNNFDVEQYLSNIHNETINYCR
jgi:hypothetical protein